MKNCIRRIYNFFKKEYLLFSLLIIVTNITVVLVPFYNSKFIDELIKIDNISLIKFYALLVAVFLMLNLSFEVMIGYLKLFLAEKTKYSFKMDVISHLRKIDYLRYKTFDSIYLNQRIEQDIGKVIEFVLNNFPIAVVYVVKLIIVIYILIRINIYIALSMCISIPIYTVLYLKFKSPLRECGLQIRESQDVYYKEVGEQLKYMYNIKLDSNYALEDNFMNDIFRKHISVFRNYVNIIIKFNVTEGILSLIFQISTLIFGGYFVVNGKMTVGELAAIGSYYGIMESIVKYYSSLGKEYQLSKAANNRIEELLNIEVESNGEERIPTLDCITGNISFKFPEREYLFKDYKVELKKGDIFVISGVNGSGKTTLIQIINGIINGEEIELKYNNIDRNRVDMNYVRKFLISNVPQDINVRNELVENYFVIPVKGENEAIEYIVNFFGGISTNSKFSLYEFLKKVFKLEIRNLSGGDRQFIYILRSILLDKDVLIMDEPTSNLDYERTVWLSDYLEYSKSKRILIIVTHDTRLSFSSSKTLSIGSKKIEKKC